jgi:hypothetical protein
VPYLGSLVDTATARLERRRSIIPTLPPMTPSCLGPRRCWLQVWDASQNVLKLSGRSNGYESPNAGENVPRRPESAATYPGDSGERQHTRGFRESRTRRRGTGDIAATLSPTKRAGNDNGNRRRFVARDRADPARLLHRPHAIEQHPGSILLGGHTPLAGEHDPRRVIYGMPMQCPSSSRAIASHNSSDTPNVTSCPYVGLMSRPRYAKAPCYLHFLAVPTDMSATYGGDSVRPRVSRAATMNHPCCSRAFRSNSGPRVPVSC